MELVGLVIALTRSMPRNPGGLAHQMERAAISIPSNIAEGYGRSSRAQYLHFLSIAAGSLRELETQLIIAQRNHLADSSKANKTLEKADEVGRLLQALRMSLSRLEKQKGRWPG